MNISFINTSNYSRMVKGVEALRRRDPSLPGLGLIYGKWGTGKSTALEHFFSVDDIFYIVMERLWRPRRMLEEMCDVMNLGESEYRLDRLSDQVCDGLKRYRKSLFIDEADYLLKNSVMLDVVRDLHEKSRTPIILIGMEKLHKNLQRHGQFFSRILPAAIVEFQTITPSEIVMVTKKWTGLDLEVDASELFCQYTEGDFRYIVGYLISFEAACKANETTTITAKMVEAVVKQVSGRAKPKNMKKQSALTYVGRNQL